MIALLWAAAAWADTIELDTGAAVRGHITAWSADGCAVAMESGDLRGMTVTMPCERIVAFRRDGAPLAVAPEPVVAAPVPVAVAPVVAAPVPVAVAPVAAPAPVVAAPVPVAAPALPLSPAVAAAEPEEPEEPEAEEVEDAPRRARWVQSLKQEWEGVQQDLGLGKEAEAEAEGDTE